MWWLVVGVGDGVEFVIRGWVGDTNRFVLIVCVFQCFIVFLVASGRPHPSCCLSEEMGMT